MPWFKLKQWRWTPSQESRLEQWHVIITPFHPCCFKLKEVKHIGAQTKAQQYDADVQNKLTSKCRIITLLIPVSQWWHPFVTASGPSEGNMPFIVRYIPLSVSWAREWSIRRRESGVLSTLGSTCGEGSVWLLSLGEASCVSPISGRSISVSDRFAILTGRTRCKIPHVDSHFTSTREANTGVARVHRNELTSDLSLSCLTSPWRALTSDLCTSKGWAWSDYTFT